MAFGSAFSGEGRFSSSKRRRSAFTQISLSAHQTCIIPLRLPVCVCRDFTAGKEQQQDDDAHGKNAGDGEYGHHFVSSPFESGGRIRPPCGHNPVEFGILREFIRERQDDVAVEQQTFARIGLLDVGKLVLGNTELFGENLPVTGCLTEHINEIGVFKDILNFAGSQQIVG